MRSAPSAVGTDARASNPAAIRRTHISRPRPASPVMPPFLPPTIAPNLQRAARAGWSSGLFALMMRTVTPSTTALSEARSPTGPVLGHRTISRALWIVLAFLFAIEALHELFGFGGGGLDGFFNKVVFNLLIFAAAVICLLRAAAIEHLRAAWPLLGLSLVSFGIGRSSGASTTPICSRSRSPRRPTGSG